MEIVRVTLEELTELLKSLEIGTSYLEDVKFKENDLTREEFCRYRDLNGSKWNPNKYYDGVDRRDSWSDWGHYWIEDHPVVQYIKTTHMGWQNGDGTGGTRKFVEVYCKGE